jgi:hypothetical protein
VQITKFRILAVAAAVDGVLSRDRGKKTKNPRPHTVGSSLPKEFI